MTILTDRLTRTERGSSQVCPFCGQPARDQQAQRRLRASKHELAELLAAARLASHESPVETATEQDAQESDESQNREKETDVARRTHDLRVNLRIF